MWMCNLFNLLKLILNYLLQKLEPDCYFVKSKKKHQINLKMKSRELKMDRQRSSLRWRRRN